MKITIIFEIFELVLVLIFNFNNFDFLEQISQKRILSVKAEKINITTEFFLFELVQVPNLSKKVYFQFTTKKVSMTIEFCIFKLVWVPNFSLNCDFFDQIGIFEKGYFQSKTEKGNITIEFCKFKSTFSQRCHVPSVTFTTFFGIA